MEAAPFGCSQFPELRSYSASTSSLFSLHNHIYRKNLKFKYSSSLSVRASAASDSVTLLDYGAGNVRSVRNAIHFLGVDIKDVQTPADILNANRLIFPGVGAFAAAMDVLNHTGMAEALCTYIKNDRPFLGICLGLQLLFESSEENGPVQGLGLIPTVIGRFDSSNVFRVPHIGWNTLEIRKDSEILDDIGNHHIYFVHSYGAMPSKDNEEWISSTCNYGDNFIASVRKGNVHAVQFHPEKSRDVGLSVLRRFLHPKFPMKKNPMEVKASKLAKRVIACLDVRANDKGDLVVTKGDQYDVREHTKENEVRNLGKPVELASQYYKDGTDEVSFLNITGFRDFPLGDLPMLQVLRRTSENVFVPLTVGGGIRDFTDANGRHYSSLEVASEYFRSGADKFSIGSDAVYAAEAYLKTGVKTGKSSLEQISRVYRNQFLGLRSSSAISSSLFSLRNHLYRNYHSLGTSAASDSVTLLDYGAGNIKSVWNAIRSLGLGLDIKVVQTPEGILNANRLIFPGVGAFAAAMDVLNKTGMAEALRTYIKNNRPYLGIALGLQLLFETSEENGPVQGLGLISGAVERFDSFNGFKVPHNGLNTLQIIKYSKILDDIGNHPVHFAHSYRAMPSNDNKEWVTSTCNYGVNFIASVRMGNVHAVQFQPEMSREVGLSVLRSFLSPKVSHDKEAS